MKCWLHLCSASLLTCVTLNCQTSGSTLQLSDVQGLPQALANRPTAGPSFLPGRAAVVDSSGLIEGAIGNMTDCVHVDGTSAPCSATSTSSGTETFVDNETPTGVIDGANAAFVLAGTPVANSLALFRNGLRMKAGEDFDIAANIVTFRQCCIPTGGDILLAAYRSATNASSTRGLSSGQAMPFRFVESRFLAQLVAQQAERDSKPAATRVGPRNDPEPVGGGHVAVSLAGPAEKSVISPSEVTTQPNSNAQSAEIAGGDRVVGGAGPGTVQPRLAVPSSDGEQPTPPAQEHYTLPKANRVICTSSGSCTSTAAPDSMTPTSEHVEDNATTPRSIKLISARVPKRVTLNSTQQAPPTTTDISRDLPLEGTDRLPLSIRLAQKMKRQQEGDEK